MKKKRDMSESLKDKLMLLGRLHGRMLTTWPELKNCGLASIAGVEILRVMGVPAELVSCRVFTFRPSPEEGTNYFGALGNVDADWLRLLQLPEECIANFELPEAPHANDLGHRDPAELGHMCLQVDGHVVDLTAAQLNAHLSADLLPTAGVIISGALTEASPFLEVTVEGTSPIYLAYGWVPPELADSERKRLLRSMRKGLIQDYVSVLECTKGGVLCISKAEIEEIAIAFGGKRKRVH